MSALVLKIIAIVAMALDHIGWNLYSQSYEAYIALRLVGRIAMPIFCFFIAQGFRKTSNPMRYAARLAVAALLSEIPFNLCFSSGSSIIKHGSLNVMVTLFLGLAGLIMLEWIKSRTGLLMPAVIPSLLMALFAELIGSDYGFYGVIMILLFYLIDPESKHATSYICAVSLLFGSRLILEFVLKSALSLLTPAITVAPLKDWDFMQLLAAASALLLIFYNGKAGKQPQNRIARAAVKYSFYLFYPIHLMIIWFVFG